jgi:hypothetical protein
VTQQEFRQMLSRLPREEKETLMRLPFNEAMVIAEMHHYFPGAHRVEESSGPSTNALGVGPGDA